MSVSDAEKYISEGQFGETNMLPKIEAAIEFLKSNPEGTVLITSLSEVANALKGKAGTCITA